MANTTLTQTGAQVQAILDKADDLPASLGTAGQVLAVNSGATGMEWQTPSGGGSPFHKVKWTSAAYATGIQAIFTPTGVIYSGNIAANTEYECLFVLAALHDPTNDYLHASSGNFSYTIIFNGQDNKPLFSIDRYKSTVGFTTLSSSDVSQNGANTMVFPASDLVDLKIDYD